MNLLEKIYRIFTIICLIIIIIGIVYTIKLNTLLFHMEQEYLTETDNNKQVIENCTNYLKLNPFDAKVYKYRGIAYGKDKKYEKAIKDLLTSKKKGFKTEELYSFLSCYFINIDNHEKSIKYLKEGIKYNPNSYRLYNNMAYYKLTNDYDLQDALRDINMSLSIKPFPEAYHTRAEIYRKLGMYEYAISDCNEALDEKDLYYCNCEKGYSLMKLGNTKEGIKNLEICKKHSEEDHDYYYKELYEEYLD